MLISDLAVPTGPCALPDLTQLDPRKKNREYVLQYGRGFLWAYHTSGSVDFYRGRAKYKLADDYANGDNPVPSVFRKSRQLRREEGIGAQLDFRPLALLHKPLMSVEGLLKDHSYEAMATPVDPLSRAEAAEYEGRLRAWMEHQQFLQSLGNVPPGGPGAEIPLDSDELDLHLQVSYKIREAIDLEQKIAYALYLADFARQDQQCTRDEAVRGVSAMYLRRQGPRRLPVRLEVGDCFFLPARSEDFPNLQAGAHIERLPLGQVLAEIDADPDTTLTTSQRETLKGIASRNMQGTGMSYGYGWDRSLGSEPELAGQVEVIRFAFVSTDLEVQKELTNKLGNKQIFPANPDYTGPKEDSPSKAKDVKIHRKPVQNWYEGTLILNTDIGYGCRKAYEQLRDEDNPFACLPLYVVNAPGMVGGRIKSMVERCQPLVDAASRAFVKMNHTIAKWPDIYAKFNQDVLREAATDTKGAQAGQTPSTATALEQFFREAVLVGNETDDQGNALGKAVEIGLTPVAQACLGHWNTIERCKNEIADITGVNGAVSGADPASRQGEGVTQLAISGSQNALNHLFVAKHSRFERVAKAIAASVKAGEDKGRAPLTGSMQVTDRNGTKRAVYVRPSPGIAQRQFQIKIEQKPTEQQWVDFYSYMKNFTLGPDPILAPRDVADLWLADNLKLARYLLGIRYSRAMKRRDETAARRSEDQGKQAQMAAQAAGEQERQTSLQNHQQRMAEIAETGRWHLLGIKAQHDGNLGMRQQDNETKLFAQEMAQQHAAEQSAADREQDLMQHDAELSSQEQQADLQRQHEQQLARMVPADAP